MAIVRDFMNEEIAFVLQAGKLTIDDGNALHHMLDAFCLGAAISQDMVGYNCVNTSFAVSTPPLNPGFPF